MASPSCEGKNARDGSKEEVGEVFPKDIGDKIPIKYFEWQDITWDASPRLGTEEFVQNYQNHNTLTAKKHNKIRG